MVSSLVFPGGGVSDYCCASYSDRCFVIVTDSRIDYPAAIWNFPDEYGRPFIILKEQQAKARVKGLEAVRVRTISEDYFATAWIESHPTSHFLQHNPVKYPRRNLHIQNPSLISRP